MDYYLLPCNGLCAGFDSVSYTTDPIAIVDDTPCIYPSCRVRQYGQADDGPKQGRFPTYVVNNSNSTVTVEINGSVDDDIVIDGSIYEAGQFGSSQFGNPLNGAHDFNAPYRKTLAPGEGITIAANDNYGGGVGYDLTLSLKPVSKN